MAETATKVRKPRIKYPADAIRTREQILAELPKNGAVLHNGSVWAPCWNCGGSGDYPSSMIPAGRCRLYCWRDKTAELFGKLSKSIDTYVKQCQAADRADYRAELERPAREATAAVYRAEQERQEAERQAEQQRAQDDLAARKAVSQWVGAPGDRIETTTTLVDVRSIQSSFGSRLLYRFRDDAGNVLVWWTSSGAPELPAKGGRAAFTATVKSHDEYDGERQTAILRVKVAK